MLILKSQFDDYQLLDSGDGKRLERFGKFVLSRPDPQAIWKSRLSQKDWDLADAIFDRTSADKGIWRNNDKVPSQWIIRYKSLSLIAKLTPFKHTGIFPEQAAQWDFIMDKITEANRPINVLNLFGYTGASTLAAASVGAKVTHVDGSKPSVAWARENQKVSGLEDKPIRWIIDDAVKFVEREIRRGNKYDAIIMDPPIYGHGPSGEKWDFNLDFPKLLDNCRQLLSENPLFILVNAYAISSSALMLENVLGDYFKDLGGQIEVGELVLKEENSERLLSTGIFARWFK